MNVNSLGYDIKIGQAGDFRSIFRQKEKGTGKCFEKLFFTAKKGQIRCPLKNKIGSAEGENSAAI